MIALFRYFDMFYPLLKQKWSSYQFVPQFVFRDITAFSNITQGNYLLNAMLVYAVFLLK